jgi:hypothetical protein
VGGRGEYVLTAVSSSASSNFLQSAWFFDFRLQRRHVSEWVTISSSPSSLLFLFLFRLLIVLLIVLPILFRFCFWFFYLLLLLLLLILLLSASDSSSDSFTFCFWVFFWWFFIAFWFWFFFWFFLYSAFDPWYFVNHHLQAPIIITVDSFIHSDRNIHIGGKKKFWWLPLWIPTS